MNAIIFHKSDADGILSGLVTARGYNQTTPDVNVMYGWTYGERPIVPEDPWEKYENIAIVDLTYAPVMDDPALHDKVVWIDHHRTAIDKYEPRQFRGLRAERYSACRLCWDFFFPYEERPHFLDLVEDHDLFRHVFADSVAFDLGLSAGSRHSTLRRLLGQGPDSQELLERTIRDGRTIERFLERKDRSLAGFLAHDLPWEGRKFIAMNSASGGSRQIDSAVRGDHDGILIWKSNGQEALVSLYASPRKSGIDLSPIAVKYGGGGHAGACGFRMPLQKWADILLAAAH